MEELQKIEIRLANSLKKLPSESLAALAKTDDQLAHLIDRRAFNKLVADSWIALIGFGNDPLEALVETKQISQATQNYVHCLVDFFQSLWGVVQVGWRFIQKEIESQFENACDFFEAILRVWFNNDFAICLEPFWKFTVSDLNKSAKVITASQETISDGKKTLPNQLGSLAALSLKFKNIWLVLALNICYENINKNSTLKNRIRSFEQKILNFSDLAEEWSAKKRPSKRYSRLTSFEFQNGYQTKGNLSTNVTISQC